MPDPQGGFQYIKLPDGSYGKFVASASDDQIRTAITKDFPTAFTAQTEAKKGGFSLAEHPILSALTGAAKQAGSAIVDPGLTGAPSRSPDELAAGVQFGQRLKAQGKSPWNPLNYLDADSGVRNMAGSVADVARAPIAPALDNPNRAEGIGQTAMNILLLRNLLRAGRLPQGDPLAFARGGEVAEAVRPLNPQPVRPGAAEPARNPLASVSGGSNPQPIKISVNRAEDLADIKARVDMLRQELALQKGRAQVPSEAQAGETRRAASLPGRDVTASQPGSAIAEVNTPARSYVAKNKATMQRMEDAAKVREALAARGVVAPKGGAQAPVPVAQDAQAALVQSLQETPAGQKGGWGGKRAGAGRPKKAGAAEPISQGAGEAAGIQDRVQAKYGKNYDLPKPEQGMGSHWLFPDGTSSGGDSGDVSHADMVEHGMGGASTEENFTKSTGAVRVLLARDGTLRPARDVANIDAFAPINDGQMTKLAKAASQFRWELYSEEGPSQTGVGDFRAFSDAVRKYYEAAPAVKTKK